MSDSTVPDPAHTIQKFNPLGGRVAQWGSYGSGPGVFEFPSGIAIDSAGSVYVRDLDTGQVQKFPSQGGFLGQWNVGALVTDGYGRFDIFTW